MNKFYNVLMVRADATTRFVDGARTLAEAEADGQKLLDLETQRYGGPNEGRHAVPMMVLIAIPDHHGTVRYEPTWSETRKRWELASNPDAADEAELHYGRNV